MTNYQRVIKQSYSGTDFYTYVNLSNLNVTVLTLTLDMLPFDAALIHHNVIYNRRKSIR